MAVNKKMVISAVAVLVFALVFVTLVTEYGSPSVDDKQLANEKIW